MGSKIKGGPVSPKGFVGVDENYQMNVVIESDTDNKPGYIGAVKFMTENSNGNVLGPTQTHISQPETDVDYRLRVSTDTMLDDELFNYTAQNTGKYTIVAAAVNLAPSWTTGGYNTNPTSVLTTTSGATLQTYAYFTLIGTGTIALDVQMAFSYTQSTIPTNSTIDFGLFVGSTTNPFAPTDGVYFRVTSSGIQGIINYNGFETSTGIIPLSNGSGTYSLVSNTKYQFIIDISVRGVEFWINPSGNSSLVGKLNTPDGQGSPFMSASLPFRIRHAIAGGSANGSLNGILVRYNIRLGGVFSGSLLSNFSNRCLGTYQGLSGGTMGSLMFGAIASGSISAPAATVPTNTTAALGSGLGGVVYETATLAAATDGVLLSYQVPAGTTAVQGRKLVLTGIGLSSFIQAALTGGPYCARFYIAFGHTAVSLATAQSTFVKAPVRIHLPFIQTVTSGQAVSTFVSQSEHYYSFSNPIYVNPGEFVALVSTKIGTAPSAGTIAHIITYSYGWE